jgi:hypothetical protein
VGWQVEAVPVLIAGNTFINSTGAFIYNGTPKLGNPPIVAITTASKDPFGNTVQPSDSLATSPEFIVLGSSGSYLQIAAQSGLASALLGTGDAAESSPGILDAVISGAGGTRQLLTELQSPGFGGNVASVQLGSQSQDSTVNSFIALNCANRVLFGVSGNAWWTDALQQLLIPASSGPFINGETFHNVGGGVRVKKVPWNGVWVDGELSWAGPGTTTLGSLPDSSYYPNQDRHLPVATNAAAAQNARLFISSSTGTVQLAVSAGGAGIGGLSTVYPTN